MKTLRWNILPIVLWFSSAAALLAVESISESFVASATVIRGTNANTGAQASTYFSFPMVGPAVSAGTITGIGANSLTDSNANWQAGTFSSNQGSFYVEFASGLMADIAGANVGTKTLTLYADVSSAAVVGAPYRVRRHLTINDFFGSNNNAGLRAGTSPTRADTVMLQDAETQATLTFFYFSPSNAWYSTGLPAGNTAVYPEQGVIVIRRAAGDLVLCAHGRAKEGVTQVPIYSGLNLVGTLKTARSIKLSELNLYTGDPLTGVAGGTGRTADNLIVVNADQTTVTYYYCPFPDNDGLVGWRDVVGNLCDNTLIPPGCAFFIQRKAPRGNFTWAVPAE